MLVFEAVLVLDAAVLVLEVVLAVDAAVLVLVVVDALLLEAVDWL